MVRISHLLIFFCLSISCFAQKPDEEVVAKRIKSTDVYSDKEFVVNVTDITVVDNRIVLVDQDLAKIIFTDSTFNSWETFGLRGDGPLEFKKPSALMNDKAEGMLYVYDIEKFRLWPIDFDKKAIGKGVSFNYMLFQQTVAIENSNMYFATVSNPSVDVMKYSLKGKKKERDISLHENSVKSFLGRSILSGNNRFVVVSHYDGLVVDTYDENWKLIETNDLSTLPIVKKRLSMNKASGVSISGSGKNQINVKSGKSTISSVRLYGDDLYLLAYSRDRALKSRANVILRYTFKNKSWSPSGEIILPQENSYGTFQLLPDGNKIVAFDRENGTIDLFEIKG